MEIQSDLIILQQNNYLPLPWPVRGPLGLETGSEVWIALVYTGERPEGLPDIIVTPLQSEYLTSTYALDVELGERAGAVADFLTWLGDSIASETINRVNIVLSETITLEGRKKHKMHLVLEPASDNSVVKQDQLERVIEHIKENHSPDVLSYHLEPVYPSKDLRVLSQQSVPVFQGWLRYGDWKRRILETYPHAEKIYDLTRMVVSSNPQQRLLRFIIPKKGVIELRVPHRNRPGALREISNVIRKLNYNILSMRLSRTPPADKTPNTSVFVAACEPLQKADDPSTANNTLIQSLQRIDPKYSIDSVSISSGKPAEKALFLTPKSQMIVAIDPDIAADRKQVRDESAASFKRRHNALPRLFVFLSRRFFEDRPECREHFREQALAIKTIVKAAEEAGCAIIEAANPGRAEDRYIDRVVNRAVFSRLWASDACAVLALNEEGNGRLSMSIAHEIGFFAGRNLPLKVFVSNGRDKDPVFGNIVGMNRITYPDGNAGFLDAEHNSLYERAKTWFANLVVRE
jgi:hypothetical protein